MPTFDITYAAACFAGAISFLSPCVLPLVPAYLCFVTGTSLERLVDRDNGSAGMTKRIAICAIFFIMGFSTVFILMGASASAINQLIFGYRDIAAKIAGTMIAIFGLHFMGLLRVPFLYREVRFNTYSRPTGLIGAYIIGLAFAFGWTPCIGPILATILTIAASRESLGYGVSLLAAYALGLGLPFFIAAISIQPFMHFLKRFRRHMRKVEITSGILLLITGILIFADMFSILGFYLIEFFPKLGTLG